MADHAKAQVTIRADDERERVGLAAAAMKMAAALITNQVIPPPSVPHADSVGSQPSLIPSSVPQQGTVVGVIRQVRVLPSDNDIQL